MSVTVYNNNTGPGTFNNVSGDQINNNIIAIYNPTTRDNTFHAYEAITISNEHYYGLLNDVLYIQETFNALRRLWPRDSSIASSCQSLDEFVRIFSIAARALEIIAKLPGSAKSLRFFQNIITLIDECQLKTARIKEEIIAYQELQPILTSSFWRQLFAVIFAKHSWEQMIKELQLLLSSNRDMLDRFLRFLTTSAWRSLIPTRHARELDTLIHRAGLYPESLSCDVDIQKIIVVDHLGRRLVVPMEFCISWADFDFLIKRYTKDAVGSELIQRNSWEVIHAQDNCVVSIPKFSQVVKPNMLLELSVVLWKPSSPEKVCPQCEYNNHENIEYNGWIECYQCSKRFQIRRLQDLTNRNPGNKSTKNKQQTWMEMIADYIFKRRKIETPELITEHTHVSHDNHIPPNVRGIQYEEEPHFNRVSVRALDTSLQTLDMEDTTRLNERPRYVGSLWYLHAPSPYKWQKCQASLYQDILHLTWHVAGAGTAIVSLDLPNCNSIMAIPSLTHPSVRNDIGTLAAQSQSPEHDEDTLMDVLVPFHMIYDDGVERLAAESQRERIRWINRLWDVLHSLPPRPTAPGLFGPRSPSLSPSSTASIHIYAPSASPSPPLSPPSPPSFLSPSFVPSPIAFLPLNESPRDVINE